MSFVDCYIAAVPTEKRDEYLDHLKAMSPLFKDHGATRVADAWGADVPDGEVTSFPLAVKAEENETVVLGWVEWPSKAVRDENMPKVMSDERMKSMGPMPFDGKRLIFGGFEFLHEE